MIIVKLQGGLGNQMFQYAAGKAAATFYNTRLLLDHRFLEDRSEKGATIPREYDLDIFTLEANRASNKELRIFEEQKAQRFTMLQKLTRASAAKRSTEPHFHYSDILRQNGPNQYLDGYWQSPLYFQDIEMDLRNDFQFRQPIQAQSAALLQSIRDTESVCINVRRTDFLQNSFHPVCGMPYFTEAIAYLKAKQNGLVFYVFSDDKNWCKTQFGHLDNFVVVDEMHDGDKFANKLSLMASCKHFIIPNSSFAWWAVWLANRKDNVVIAPKTWFNDPTWDTRDLLDPHWILMENA